MRALHWRAGVVIAGLIVLSASSTAAQQVVDSAFQPRVANAAYRLGAGPLVLVDEAHNNRHTIDGSYRPFAELLRADGFRVEPLLETFTSATLGRASILVIINALAAENVDNWVLPTPSAFTTAEMDVVREWVGNGGSLLLVADHMPFPGAAEELASRLGVVFTNGFAIDTSTWDPLVFRRSDRTLSRHPIMHGRSAKERIDSIASFWGQAFRAIDPAVMSLFSFGPGVVSYEPVEAWRFSEETPVQNVEGWLQGAALIVGKGRVVVLGEAGMLSAQLMGARRVPAGMNAPMAHQNQQFVLNMFHWLSRLLPAELPSGASIGAEGLH